MIRQWVLLRGLIRQQRHWELFPQHMQEAFPDDFFHLIDLPGNGLLCDRPSPTTVREMVTAAITQLKLKKIKPPYYLLSISMGGMVAIEWMHHHRKDIMGAVIINSSLRDVGSFRDRLRPHNYPSMLKHILLDRSDRAREQLILDVSSNLYPHKSELVKKWVGYAETHPTNAKNVMRQLMAAARYRAPKRKPHDNVLLLNSAHDRLVNPSCSELLAQKWDWPLITHPTAGHDLPLDDGLWIVEQIQDWLQSQPD